jgi:hypothetical protein
MGDYGTSRVAIHAERLLPRNSPSSSTILLNAGQLFAARLRYPIGLDSQFRQDDLRRIVARQARDVATEMAARAAKV